MASRIFIYGFILPAFLCLSGGCANPGAGFTVFDFLHHPEAYVRGEGMPPFEELTGEMNVELKKLGIRGDLRKGFRWDWSQPLSFDVELPPSPVLTFEWGFSKDTITMWEDFSINVTVSRNNKDETVADISGKVGFADNGTMWRFERIDLGAFDRGKARVSFEFTGFSEGEAREHFLLACPRIFSADGKPGRHIVIVAVDTLRADHLSCYGYNRPTSPGIDEWAKGGSQYEYCISTSPWTFPSFASILTARYPSICGGTTNIRFLPEDETTLAEILCANGFATLSIVNSGWVSQAVNFQQGFDGAVQFITGPCPPTFSYARQWIASHADQDTFIFLHFMDPHQPYGAPEPYNTMYDPGYSGRYKNTFGGDIVEELRSGKMELSDSELRHIQALYDGEITYFDSVFEQFLGFLNEQEILDSTLIVLTADHGEEFMEHGGFEHGHSLYDEVIHVPLIINGMGFPKGKVNNRTASTMDIFPTLLDFLNIEPPGNLNGHSLLQPEPEKERLLISEQLLYGEELKGVTTPEYRYIYHTVSGAEELYELQSDARMLHSVATDKRATARSFRSFVTNYTIGKGTPWHLFFMRDIKPGRGIVYSGSVTCEAGFASVNEFKFDDTDILAIEGNRIDFSIELMPSYEKEIEFITNDEAAPVSFKLERDGIPLDEGSIFVGPELDEITGDAFTLDISDERFTLGQPNLRRKVHNGVFIWAIPARLREQLQPDLTPEMVEELKSIGYLN